MFNFANIWFLLLLFLLPLLVYLYFKKPFDTNLKLSLASQNLFTPNIKDYILYHLPFLLRILLLVLIIIALARPQFGRSFIDNKHYGLDIFFAVDTSQSMSARDLDLGGHYTDRLTVLKHVLKDFIIQRTQDRLGLVVFGEEAFTQCPLTMDHGALLDLIHNLQIGMVGNATAIGTAIALSVKRLKDLPAKSKIIILMTDGQNTAGDISPEMASSLAKNLNIKIYTIGIGQEGEVPIIVDSPAGPIQIMQEIKIDEDLLTQIAESTGGLYYRAKTSKDLQKIYADINKLEKREIKNREYNSFTDIYENFLWLILLLFGTELILSGTILFRL